MQYRRLLKLLIALVGAVIAAIGMLFLAIATSGSVSQGQTGLVLTGAGFLLAAGPALAAPFSTRVSKGLLLFALVCFAVLAIRLSFWPQTGITPTPITQAAVMAFAILLVARVFLRRRGKGAGLGT